MKTKLFCVALVLICLNTKAQTKQNDQSASQGKTVTSKTAYSYEKKVNGITVQFYTQEQFDQLPEKRKSYYLEHKELYRIIDKKKSVK